MQVRITYTKTKQILSTEAPPAPPKIKVGETLANLTGSMNTTSTRIKESLKFLPDKFNITRANFDSFLDTPFNLINKSLEQIIDYVKSLGTVLGILSTIMIFIIIMPAVELIMIGLRIARMPANIWLGSARGVTANLRYASNNSLNKLPKFFAEKKIRWNESIKMT